MRATKGPGTGGQLSAFKHLSKGYMVIKHSRHNVLVHLASVHQVHVLLKDELKLVLVRIQSIDEVLECCHMTVSIDI